MKLNNTFVKAKSQEIIINPNKFKMAKSSGLKNAPSTTGNKSGGGRGNNSPKPSSSGGSSSGSTSKGGSGKK